jgi:hypothetical protein
MRMSVRPELVAAPQDLRDPVRKSLGHETCTKTRRAHAGSGFVEHIQHLRQSVQNPAILCREIWGTVRLDIDSERDFKHVQHRHVKGLPQHRGWVVAALLASRPLSAQSEAVPASSALYDHIEAISAFFPAAGVFLGERGVSARQVASYLERLRLTIEAAPPSARKNWAQRNLAELLQPVRSERSPSAAWRADIAGSDASNERMTANGLGSIDAVTNPFEARRDGWRVEKGAAASYSPTVAVRLPRCGAAVQPRFSSHVAEGRKERIWQGTVHRAYARGVWRNVALRVGADELLWGQSPIGALFISGNAPPLLAIAIATDSAFTLPWWFRFAGPTRATLMLADLGGEQDPPHAKLAGWQVSVMPWRRFELGVAVMTQTGGSGGPKATFLKRVIDLFPVIDALAPQHADLLFSNKLAGGNLRLRLPELSGLDLYYELQIDDFDGRRLRSSMVDDASHLIGARLPIVTRHGLLAIRGEWHNSALRIYEHTQFRSGVTYKRHLIGSPLGPHAAAGYLATTWQPTPRQGLELVLADERRDPALYSATTTQPRDRGFRFIRVTDDPDVRRARVLLTLRHAMPFGALALSVGHTLAWRTGQTKHGESLGQVTFSSVYLPRF